MAYRLNLDLSPRSRLFGSVQVFLNWVNTPDGHTEPAMYFRQANGGRTVASMPLSHLHNLMGSNGYALTSIVATAAELSHCIGFGRMDRYAAKNIADAILEWADMLIRMPGEPPADAPSQQIVADAVMRMRVNGDVVAEFDVTTEANAA